jgi:DnaJ family protein C protein 28
MPNIEELMRRAMEEGKFDNLPGKGKPLHLDHENPYADPEWELAFRMLKDAGYSLPWIETLRDIENDLESARQELRVAYEGYQVRVSGSSPVGNATVDWERSQSTFKEKLDALNKRIRLFNLQVPSPRFQRPMLRFDQELQKLIS